MGTLLTFIRPGTTYQDKYQLCVCHTWADAHNQYGHHHCCRHSNNDKQDVKGLTPEQATDKYGVPESMGVWWPPSPAGPSTVLRLAA